MVRINNGAFQEVQLTDGTDNATVEAYADTQDEVAANRLAVNAGMYMWDGSTLKRVPITDSTADALSTAGMSLAARSLLYTFNGTTWDRTRTPGNSAPNIGVQRVANQGTPSNTEDLTANDSDKTFTVSAGEQWHVKGLYIHYLATANVGNRIIQVHFRDSYDNVLYVIGSIPNVVASQEVGISLMPGVARETAFSSSQIVGPMIPDIMLPASYDIRVYDSAGIDAAADNMEVFIAKEINS